MYAHLIQAAADEGLTLHEIVASVPHDAAAAVVYTLVGASAWLIWWGNRHSGREDGTGKGEGADGAGESGGGED